MGTMSVPSRTLCLTLEVANGDIEFFDRKRLKPLILMVLENIILATGTTMLIFVFGVFVSVLCFASCLCNVSTPPKFSNAVSNPPTYCLSLRSCLHSNFPDINFVSCCQPYW